jgi:hypothetical protein
MMGQTVAERGTAMENFIDVRGLREEDIQLLKELAGLLKQRVKAKRKERGVRRRKIVLGTHPSDVIGALTRKEIYEHL